MNRHRKKAEKEKREKKHKARVPREVKDDGEEDERKYRVLGKTWDQKVKTLRSVFSFVVLEGKFFATLDKAPHTASFDTCLVASAQVPIHIKPIGCRYYWATACLAGYKAKDKTRAEVRTEEKIGKRRWEQVVKLGGDGSKTLKRGEYERHLDDFGVNIGVYSPEIRRAIRGVVGQKTLYPLAHIDVQSIPVLFHPDGRKDVLFEIKFDCGKGKTFDGFTTDIVEIEIEVKNFPKDMPDSKIEALLDLAEKMLFRDYGDNLEPIFESKPAVLFRHLVSWRDRNETEFTAAFRSLRGDKWKVWERPAPKA